MAKSLQDSCGAKSVSLSVVIERNFRNNPTKEYVSFAKSKDACRKCSEFNHYKQVTQSEGNTNRPTFMIIGEAPGSDEVEQNRPFIGQAGQKLRQILRKHIDAFNVNTTLISNVMACRPLNNKLPKDRKVIEDCSTEWLCQEIRIVQPKILILLGNTPLDFVAEIKGITSQRGKWLGLNPFLTSCGVKAMIATYHPSYVIRSERMGYEEVSKDFEEDFALIAREYSQKII